MLPSKDIDVLSVYTVQVKCLDTEDFILFLQLYTFSCQIGHKFVFRSCFGSEKHVEHFGSKCLYDVYMRNWCVQIFDRSVM